MTKLIFLDTETTSEDPSSAEICETAIIADDQVVSFLYDTELPIPPAASAKNGISRRMLKGFPKFVEEAEVIYGFLNQPDTLFVAHFASYDREVLSHTFERLGYDTAVVKDDDRWLCTHRLARKVLNPDTTGYEPENMTQAYLRYYLDLDVDDELPAHRAYADVQILKALYEKLVAIGVKYELFEDNIESIVAFYHKPIIYSVWPFGKHRGEKIENVPNDYLAWCLANMDCFDENNSKYDPDLLHSIQTAKGLV